jgi:hypothetical protein
MKALTIYEKHLTADAYRVGGFYSPYALVSREKRFSDAELAAEFWQACYDGGYHCDPHGKVVIERLELRRFATRPHAAESDYQ